MSIRTFSCGFRILLVLFCIIVYKVVCFVCFCLILYIMYSYSFVCSVLCVLFHCAVLCVLFHCVVPFCVFCFIVLFCVLSVCICVLHYCHRVSTQFQLTNITYHAISYIVHRYVTGRILQKTSESAQGSCLA
jgi:hypothetical protein